MNQPIVFIAPKEIAGQTGFQVVDDETHEVVEVVLEDGTPLKGEFSYKGAEYA